MQGWQCTQIFEGHSHYVMQVVFNPKVRACCACSERKGSNRQPQGRGARSCHSGAHALAGLLRTTPLPRQILVRPVCVSRCSQLCELVCRGLILGQVLPLRLLSNFPRELHPNCVHGGGSPRCLAPGRHRTMPLAPLNLPVLLHNSSSKRHYRRRLSLNVGRTKHALFCSVVLLNFAEQ